MSAILDAGTPLFPARIYRVDQALVDLYAQVSGDQNPLHTDPAFAATTMFGRTIAHGMMTLAFLSESLEIWVGPVWSQGGVIDVTFLAPVYPGDEVSVSGRMTAAEAGIATCAVECAVGERTILAGTARWPAAIAGENV